jgi:hypothetical protein
MFYNEKEKENIKNFTDLEEKIYNAMKKIGDKYCYEEDICLYSNYSSAVVKDVLNKMLKKDLVKFKPQKEKVGEWLWQIVEK